MNKNTIISLTDRGKLFIENNLRDDDEIVILLAIRYKQIFLDELKDWNKDEIQYLRNKKNNITDKNYPFKTKKLKNNGKI